MGFLIVWLVMFLRAQKLEIGALCLILVSTLSLGSSGLIQKINHGSRTHVDASIAGAPFVGRISEQQFLQPQSYEAETTPPISVGVPVIARIPTNEPVIFLGIDDGWTKTPEVAQWLNTHKLPFTLFLTDQAVSSDYDYFKQLQSAGLNIQNHTLTHPDLTKLNYEQQKAEICGQSDKLQAIYGKRPTLFRPPYGSYNDITRRVVGECGMKAIIMWHAKADGGALQFQDINHFEPGDIILMHFRPKFTSDMQAFIDEVNRQHLSVASLEDWVQ